jgi:hypothetical protein
MNDSKRYKVFIRTPNTDARWTQVRALWTGHNHTYEIPTADSPIGSGRALEVVGRVLMRRMAHHYRRSGFEVTTQSV